MSSRWSGASRCSPTLASFALHSESFDEILTEACRLVSEALGTKRAKVLEIQPDGQSLLVRAGVGWQSGIVGKLRLQMGERSSETFSIKAGKPVVTRDIRTGRPVRGTRLHEGRRAWSHWRTCRSSCLADGPTACCRWTAAELCDLGEEDTEFLRTYATILGPVIDRLHKAHRLQGTEERFRLIVENARDYAIFVADTEDRITDWLPGAEAVFGWTAAEAVGQPGSILFTPEDRKSHEDEKEIETARAEGVAPNRRWHLRKDGIRVFIDGTVTALHDDRQMHRLAHVVG